jgi:transposase
VRGHSQAKAHRRASVEVNDSTLGDLCHRTAELVDPLYERLLQLVAEKEVVLADETTQRVQAKGRTRMAWLWSFDRARRGRARAHRVRVLAQPLGRDARAHARGHDREAVRGRIRRIQQGDVPGGRERAGCWAHARRKFFEAQSTASAAAKRAMDFILELYKVERAALDADLRGTPEHLAMRNSHSRAIVGDFKAWLEAEQGRHPPRSPIGVAINYALGQWDALALFLTDPRLPS